MAGGRADAAAGGGEPGPAGVAPAGRRAPTPAPRSLARSLALLPPPPTPPPGPRHAAHPTRHHDHHHPPPRARRDGHPAGRRAAPRSTRARDTGPSAGSGRATRRGRNPGGSARRRTAPRRPAGRRRGTHPRGAAPRATRPRREPPRRGKRARVRVQARETPPRPRAARGGPPQGPWRPRPRPRRLSASPALAGGAAPARGAHVAPRAGTAGDLHLGGRRAPAGDGAGPCETTPSRAPAGAIDRQATLRQA